MGCGERADRSGEQLGGDRGQPGGVVGATSTRQPAGSSSASHSAWRTSSPHSRQLLPARSVITHIGWANLDLVDHPVAEQGAEAPRCLTHRAPGRQPVSGNHPAQLLRVRGGGGVDRESCAQPDRDRPRGERHHPGEDEHVAEREGGPSPRVGFAAHHRDRRHALQREHEIDHQRNDRGRGEDSTGRGRRSWWPALAAELPDLSPPPPDPASRRTLRAPTASRPERCRCASRSPAARTPVRQHDPRRRHSCDSSRTRWHRSWTCPRVCASRTGRLSSAHNTSEVARMMVPALRRNMLAALHIAASIACGDGSR